MHLPICHICKSIQRIQLLNLALQAHVHHMHIDLASFQPPSSTPQNDAQCQWQKCRPSITYLKLLYLDSLVREVPLWNTFESLESLWNQPSPNYLSTSQNHTTPYKTPNSRTPTPPWKKHGQMQCCFGKSVSCLSMCSCIAAIMQSHQAPLCILLLRSLLMQLA